jgi:uncharacterized protein YgiM (DUF1202 family)
MPTNALKFLFLISLFLYKDSGEILKECCGRCVGSAYCTACTTCNYCQHCNSGGSCGVCGGGSRPSYNRNSYSPKSPQNTTPSVQTRVKYYFVNAPILNVRMSPGLNNSIIDKLKYGEPVRILLLYGSAWAYISYRSYKTGYVSAAYITYTY